jgi:hypothetical protein
MSENPDVGHPAIVRRRSVLSEAKARDVFVAFFGTIEIVP